MESCKQREGMVTMTKHAASRYAARCLAGAGVVYASARGCADGSGEAAVVKRSWALSEGAFAHRIGDEDRAHARPDGNAHPPLAQALLH